MFPLKRKIWFLFLVLAAANFVFWWAWIAPYKFFPADDVTLIRFGINTHIPVFDYFMAGLKGAWLWYSDDELSPLLISGLLCNGLTAILIGRLTTLLTRSPGVGIVAMLVFLSNGWTASYYLLASYAPLSAFLTTLSFYFLVMGWRAKNVASERLTRAYLLAAGVGSGLLLFSSSGAPVAVFCITLAAFVLFRAGTLKQWWIRVMYFLAPLSLILLLFASRILRAYRHLNENLHSYHLEDAMKRFGYIPHPPFFTFFHIGSVSSSVLFWTLAVCLAVVLVTVLRRFRRLEFPLAALLLLAVLITSHSLVIDVLPFTKLGRTHFPILPLAVIFTVSSVYLLAERVAIGRWRGPVLAGALAVAVLILIQQAAYDIEMVQTRKGPLEVIEALPPGTKIYGHPDDPTGFFLVEWMGFKGYGARDLKDMRPGPPGTPRVYILGPHGPRSGRTALRHSVLPDFTYDAALVAKPANAVEYRFPYYGYFPGFLMEEEISMALFFAGDSPDFRDPDLQLTIWVWSDP